MKTARLRGFGICVLLALLTAAPAGADPPQPIESIDAWMDGFMICFRGDDDSCLHDAFARHWHAMPELAGDPNDPDAFFAFLDERRAIEAPYDFSEFQSTSFDDRTFSKTYFVGAIISENEIKAFVLTVGAWLVDGEPYLFRVRIIDDLMNPSLEINVVDPLA